MKFADINKKFSEAVAKTLAEGYQICCNTMSGSQGEVAHVNFISPEGEHYTLMLDHCSSLGSEGIWLDLFLITWAKSNELKDAVNDLEEAMRKAEAQRNKEEPCRRGSFYITRKW